MEIARLISGWVVGESADWEDLKEKGLYQYSVNTYLDYKYHTYSSSTALLSRETNDTIANEFSPIISYLSKSVITITLDDDHRH